jgi:hypothetical protein
MLSKCGAVAPRYAGGRWYCLEHFAEIERRRERSRDNPATRFLRKENRELREVCRRYRHALQRIADVDYRGNRSTESVVAYEALQTKVEQV